MYLIALTSTSVFSEDIMLMLVIGIMKAIGAKNKDILVLFLVEASTISLIGGILGVVGGVAISMIANSVMDARDIIWQKRCKTVEIHKAARITHQL